MYVTAVIFFFYLLCSTPVSTLWIYSARLLLVRRLRRTHLSGVVDRPRVGVVVSPGTVAAMNVFAPLVMVIEVIVVNLG